MSNSETDILKSIKDFLHKYTYMDPELTSEDSYGNYDDVFMDGYAQAEYDVVTSIRDIIEKGENN